MAFSQLFYRQNCLYLDRKDAAWRGPRSFELTFSMVSGPPGALDLRLCSETARGARKLKSKHKVIFGNPGLVGTIKGGLQLLVIVHESSLYSRVPHKGAGGYIYIYTYKSVFSPNVRLRHGVLTRLW